MPRVHYDALAQAVPQAKETIFVSDWLFQRPEFPVRHAISRAVLASGCVMPAFTGHEVVLVSEWFKARQQVPVRHVRSVTPSGSQVPTFNGHEVVSPDKWFHQQPDPSNVVQVEPVVPYGAVVSSYTGAEIVLLDKWWKQQPEPIRLVTATATNPSGGIIPVYRGPEVTFVSEWMGSRPDGALREVRRIVDLTQSVEALSGALEQSKTSLDRWFVVAPQMPAAGAISQPRVVAAPVTVPASAPVAPSVAGWMFAGNVAQARPLNVNLGTSVVGAIRATPEAVTADRWAFEAPMVVTAAKGQAVSGTVAPVYVLTSFDWLRPVEGRAAIAVKSVMGGMLAAPILVPAAWDWNLSRAPIFPTAAISQAVFAAMGANAPEAAALPFGWQLCVGPAIAARVMCADGGEREFFVYPVATSPAAIDAEWRVPLIDPDGAWYGLQLPIA
jgi:hypothetical protein